MKPAPKIIGGAVVVAYSPIDERHRPTGGCRHTVAGVLQGPPSGLAICQYQEQNAFYLFGCDENWHVKTDSFFVTLEEALDQAEFEYEGVRKTWMNHEPAWEELPEKERKAVWDMFYEKFHFKPSIKAAAMK